MDAFGASAAGLYALSESYLYTVEALGAYLDRLEQRRPPRHHALDQPPAARRAQAVRHRHRGAGAARRARAGRAAGADPRLPDRDAARQERGVHGSRHRGSAGILPGALVRCRLLSRHRRGPGQPLQRVGQLRFPRWRARAARAGSRGVHRALQVRDRPGDRRPAAFLPFLQVARAAGDAGAQGPGRLAVARVGLSDTRRNAPPGGARELPAGAAAALDRRALDQRKCRRTRAGNRTRRPRPFAARRRRLFRGARDRLHVHRDRLHPEIHPLPEPPAVRGRRCPLRVPPLRGDRKPTIAPRAATWRPVLREPCRAAGCRDRRSSRCSISRCCPRLSGSLRRCRTPSRSSWRSD